MILGATLMSGDGVEVNCPLGASWFQKAAELGNPEAMYELATFHVEGDGVEADPEKVKLWMFKAAGLGHDQAIEWVNENYPDQPKWLINLKNSAKELPAVDSDNSKTIKGQNTKPGNEEANDGSE